MILHFYFARRFAIAFAMLTAVFFALVALVDLIEQTRRFSDYDVSLPQRIGLTLLHTPETINQILPLIVILATVVLFIGLARSSELVVTRAAGRSALSALVAPVMVALVIGLLAVTTLGPIVAATAKRYTILSDTYRNGGQAAVLMSGDGVWLRQGGAEGQTVIRAARSNADASVFYDVTFLEYAPQGGPMRRIEAGSAALGNGAWALRDAKVWPLAADVNPEASAQTHALLRVPSTLTLDRIRETLGTLGGVSIWDMPTYILQLEQAGFSARHQIVWFQTELARPLFLMAMVLVAAAFTMRHTRFGGTGTAVLAAVLLGFGLYFIRSFAQILGENGQIPVVLAAWAPPAAAIFLALGLLLHAEDG
ncbi:MULTISPECIES: LPS export ABC transporter permease LptG [Roseobacteraceae]|jgi:lipopolysaccharide export system permease protein|uniref:Putative permease YjgP/YjgQ family protein n=1 Tax=Pseudosulfitobacter pseudonitzschiae TaxID=1402135 RepID=A0A221JZH4_9RHOB|nr:MULTISPECIES: LPS export ABC transporter permease LptG [Roseobacteraceae]ASM72142.1 putative permease YjgP/YjgQ family protein [Pseudosulfitobacter pseudonitzschiae]